MGRLSWVIQTGQMQSPETLKVEERGTRGGLMLLALKTEERGHELKMWVASRSWERQGKGFSPRASGKECSPTDILI